MPTKQPPPLPNTKDVSIYQGTSLTLSVSVSGVGSISAASVTLRIKKRLIDADADAVITKTVGQGITIVSNGSATTPGTFEVRFDPSDTATLPPQSYEYDCKMQVGSDVLMVIERSHFTVLGVVTQAL